MLSISGLADKKALGTLYYTDVIALNPGVASITNHVYQCNSLYDPDVSGIGHQFYLRDTMDTLYNSYRILESTITVTPIIDDTTPVLPAFWGVFMDTDSTLSYSEGTAVIEAQSKGKRRWGLHNGVQSTMYGNHDHSLTAKFDAATDLCPEGYNNIVDQGASPSGTDFSRYFQIWCSSINGNDPGEVLFLVSLKAKVEFCNPKFLAQS